MDRTDLNPRALLRGGGLVGTASMLDAAVTVVTSTVIARNLGATGFGSYAFAAATIGFLTIIGQMGVGPLLVRELAARRRNESPTVAAFMVAGGMSLVLGSVVLIVGLSGLAPLPSGLNTAAVWFVAILVVSSPVLAVASEVFRGLGRLGYASVVGLPMYRALHLVLIIAVPLDRGDRRPDTYLGLAVVASSLALIAAGVALVLRHSELVWARPSRAVIVAFAVGGTPITLAKAADEGAGRLPIWVLASIDQVGAAGVYALASTMAKSLLLVQSIGWQTLSPFFAGSWFESGRTRLLEQRVRQVASVSTAVAALVGVVVLLAMHLILPDLVGSDYAAAVPTALVLSLGTVIAIAAGQCGMVLNLTGNQRFTALSAIIGFAAAAVAVPFGAIAGGAVGAAVGSAIGMVTTNLLQARLALKTTGIRTIASASLGLAALKQLSTRLRRIR